MRAFSIGLVFGCLFVADIAAAAEPIRVVETRSVPPEFFPKVVTPTHDLSLSVYAFKNSRWVPDDIVAAILEALPMIAQCGIAVARVELRVLDAPAKYRFFSTPVSRELMREYAVAKPALLFVDDTYSNPAYDAEAIGLSNAESRPELSNTIWLAYGARDLPHAIAHELVHVLSDNGDHSNLPENLMRPATAPSSTRLTAAQCAHLRSAAESNGLLTRRTSVTQ